jgi:hypothetical protein
MKDSHYHAAITTGTVNSHIYEIIYTYTALTPKPTASVTPRSGVLNNLILSQIA